MPKSPTFGSTDGSGRLETRRCYVETNLSLYDDLGTWPGGKSVVMVEASREVNGQLSEQTRYYLSDLVLSATSFNQALRPQWSLENQPGRRSDTLASGHGL